MPEVDEQTWQAVRHARIRLMLEHPYLATAVARLPLLDATGRDWCSTFATDGYAIYVNLRFASTLKDDHLMFVLAHELVHCMVGHIDRRGDRDPLGWNIAIDYATNALLYAHHFELLPGALFSRSYSNMTAEAIYDDLVKQMGRDSKSSRSGSASSGGAGRGAPQSRPAEDIPEWTVQGAGRQGKKLIRGEDDRQVGHDAHVSPECPDTSDLRPGVFPTGAERQRLRHELVEAAGSMAGTMAGWWKSELAAATERPMAWQSVLAHFMSGLRRSDYRLFPPHKKHIHRGLYLPSIGIPGPQHIAVAVDTSGSMSDELLSRILTQIDYLRSASECLITIIQFDYKIQSVTRVEAWESLSTLATLGGAVVGRGGTDLCAPFEHIEADRAGDFLQLDALMVLTDGFGPSPKRPPWFPVLWVIAPDGRNQCNFGGELQMPRTDRK